MELAKINVLINLIWYCGDHNDIFCGYLSDTLWFKAEPLSYSRWFNASIIEFTGQIEDNTWWRAAGFTEWPQSEASNWEDTTAPRSRQVIIINCVRPIFNSDCLACVIVFFILLRFSVNITFFLPGRSKPLLTSEIKLPNSPSLWW
jgi:hypothetical protein